MFTLKIVNNFAVIFVLFVIFKQHSDPVEAYKHLTSTKLTLNDLGLYY